MNMQVSGVDSKLLRSPSNRSTFRVDTIRKDASLESSTGRYSCSEQDPTETAFTIDGETRLCETRILEELRNLPQVSNHEDDMSSICSTAEESLADQLEKLFSDGSDVITDDKSIARYAPARKKSFQTVANPSHRDMDDSCRSICDLSDRSCYMKWDDQIRDHVRNFRPKQVDIPSVKRGSIKERMKCFQ